MTTIVGVQGDGWAVLGSDSLSTSDVGSRVQMATPKVVQNGPYLIAGAGSVRGCNILQYGWTPPKPRGDLDKFMTKFFIPSMRKLFLENGYDIKAESQAAEHDSEFLVAVNGVIYPIYDDYSWERSADPYYVIGSGGKYALGALLATSYSLDFEPGDVRTHVYNAIDIAIDCDQYSGGEIHTYTQVGK